MLSFQIDLEQTTLDAAKSSIVYGVARNVSTPGSAVISFPTTLLRALIFGQGYQLFYRPSCERSTQGLQSQVTGKIPSDNKR